MCDHPMIVFCYREDDAMARLMPAIFFGHGNPLNARTVWLKIQTAKLYHDADMKRPHKKSAAIGKGGAPMKSSVYLFAANTAVVLVTCSALAAPLGPTQDELDKASGPVDSWLMTNKSYDGHRYVALDQITPQNVASLKAVCTFDTGVAAPAQSSPLLYQGRIYFSAGQTTAAIDAKTCKEIWRHEWQLKGKAISTPNRGVAIKDGRLVRGTSDGYLIAIDMADGKLIWERQIASAEDSHYLSMPAMIVDDRVIYGTAGADWGSRGWIGAFKLSDDSEIWRFEPLPNPGEPGAETWGSPEALSHGGGSFWTPMSVDRSKNLVYVPVGNPAPDFYGDVREGINLFTNSVIALDLANGKPAWAKQFTPHDTHDWDLTQASPLLTAQVQGRNREIMVVSGKDGRVRIFDRQTQEILSDIALARQENGSVPVTPEGVHVCPGLLGGQEWSSSAFDVNRKITVSPMVDWCGTAVRDKEPPQFKTGVHYYAGSIKQDPIDQARGVLGAIDIEKGALRWKVDAEAPLLANVTMTSGGVTFAGDLKGTLYAVNSDTGEVLLKYALGGSAGGGLFSYGLDGKQYVAAVFGPVSGFFGGTGSTTKLTLLALP